MDFIFLHIYTLVRYDMLAAKIRQFHREVQETVDIESDRKRCRQLLANIEFIRLLTTPRSSTEYTRLWRALFLGMVVVFPVAVLLLVQIDALRYQSAPMTGFQRLGLTFDLYSLIWFYSRHPLEIADKERGSSWRPSIRSDLPWVLAALVIGLNFFWLNPVPATGDPNLIQAQTRIATPLAWRSSGVWLAVACRGWPRVGDVRTKRGAQHACTAREGVTLGS